MPKEVNYAPGAKLPQATVARRKTTKKFEAKKAEAFPCNHFTYECNQNEPISYQDFSSVSTAILKGTLTTNQFKVAQLADPFCARIMDKVQVEALQNHKRLVIFQDGQKHQISNALVTRHHHQCQTFFSIWITFLKNKNIEGYIKFNMQY